MIAIAARGVTVRLGGRAVVHDVDLEVPAGQWVGLIGPNGAGKTTLVDALTGLVPATGTAMYDGRDLLAMKTNKIIRAGVGRTFQTATVFDELSVLQNLDIAGGMHRSAWRLPLARRGVPAYVEDASGVMRLPAVPDVAAVADALAGALR